MTARPRLLPDVPLPPYSYVPGRYPHPFSDPRGHRYGIDFPPPSCADPDRWRESFHYLLGLDLFNHGYFWEAHEMWEKLWHAAGRKGPAADFYKGLIQLAVAGVKIREGRPGGVLSHARRAAELFGQVRAAVGGEGYMGLCWESLQEVSEEMQQAVPAQGGDAVCLLLLPK